MSLEPNFSPAAEDIVKNGSARENPLGGSHPDHDIKAEVARNLPVPEAVNTQDSVVSEGKSAGAAAEGKPLEELACDMLGVSKAVEILPGDFETEFARHPELRSVTVSENDRAWFRDRLQFGDVVDLVRIVASDRGRDIAARRIVDWVKGCPEEIQQSLRPRRIKLSQQARDFPTSLLPAVLANFVTEVARVRDVPIEVLAPSVLGVMSGATGKGLQLRSIGGLTVIPNLFFLVGAFSGVGKSVASSIVFGPIHVYERRAQAKHAAGLAETKVALAKVQREIASLADGESGDGGSSTSLADLRARGGLAGGAPPAALRGRGHDG